MIRLCSLFTTLVFGVAGASVARRIPATIAAAEAEGAKYPRGPTPKTVLWAFDRPFGGTSERKCVTVAPDVSSAPGGSLRSGDFIMRSGLLSSVWPHATGEYKVLWLPLHTPPDIRATLLLRAARVGQPADSIRIELPAAGTPGAPRSVAGFPSLVSFPKAGQWIVIATAGDDWACFLFKISSVWINGSPLESPLKRR
jgi:hypothetical protein